MKNKLEQKIDAKFAEMGITPYIYHFTENTKPFIAITIAKTERSTYGILKEIVENCVSAVVQGEHERAVNLFAILSQVALYGVSICDKRDQFNEQRGRIIAKGRLLKHLKEIEK